MKKIKEKQFQKLVIESDKPVLVAFRAPWCEACTAMGPALKAVAAKFKGKAEVFEIDVDADSDLADEYDIMSVPTFAVFAGGKRKWSRVGVIEGAKIEKALGKWAK